MRGRKVKKKRKLHIMNVNRITKYSYLWDLYRLSATLFNSIKFISFFSSYFSYLIEDTDTFQAPLTVSINFKPFFVSICFFEGNLQVFSHIFVFIHYFEIEQTHDEIPCKNVSKWYFDAQEIHFPITSEKWRKKKWVKKCNTAFSREFLFHIFFFLLLSPPVVFPPIRDYNV